MFKNLDFLIIVPLLVIFSLGALILFSISPQYFYSQLVFFILGIFLFFFLSSIDYKIFKNFYLYFYLINLFLLLLTFLLGRITRGTMRWIEIGGFNFQPSELAKPLLVLSFSSLSLHLDLKKIKNIFIFFLIFFLPAILIFKQPDLGNALAIFALWLGIIFMRGIKKKYILFGVIIFTAILPISWNTLKPYQKERVVSFINPHSDPLGTGYNLIQSKITVGSGQFFGKGLGGGSQSQLRFLPERQSDFIFACLAEELGFIGGSFIILGFLTLILRIVLIAQKSFDQFGSLICAGTASILFFQVFINIGMNLGILPITGLTLPMVSYGGSSLISTLALLGIVQSVSRQSTKEKVIEIK